MGSTGFGACVAIGVVDKNGKPLAGVVFHDWQPGFKTMSFSVAADSPWWARPKIIRAVLAYPFDELGIQKLWAATPARNERSLRLARHLGFEREAILERHFGDDDAVMSRMFFADYQRLYGATHGQAVTTETA